MNRVSTANPAQYKAAKLYISRGLTLPQAIELARRSYVAAQLAEVDFNQCEVARTSGAHRNTVNRIVTRL